MHLHHQTGNCESAGGGIETVVGNYRHLQFDVSNNTTYARAIYNKEYELNKYCTLIGTYNGTTLSFYVDGQLVSNETIDKMAKSLRVLISADPQNNNTAGKYTNMTLKAAMLYDKALTTNEVSDLTNYFTNNDVKTKNIDVPTFRETNTSSDKDATITYPNGCGSIYTCSYSKDNGDFITVTSNPTMSFASHGTLAVKVTDGTNIITSSYTVNINS